jgi:hypothetical protein
MILLDLDNQALLIGFVSWELVTCVTVTMMHIYRFQIWLFSSFIHPLPGSRERSGGGQVGTMAAGFGMTWLFRFWRPMCCASCSPLCLIQTMHLLELGERSSAACSRLELVDSDLEKQCESGVAGRSSAKMSL